jgi:23S rRNA pseudouridine1911/1915/1917 synthase
MTIPPEQKAKSIRITEGASRLDIFLTGKFPQLSRSQIKHLIENGKVTVNAQSAKVSQKLNAGDTVSILLPSPEVPSPSDESIPLDIVYEDNDLMVINKPAGLTVHPAPGHPANTLVNSLIAYNTALVQVGDPLRPGIVHRLDKDTSGLLLIAKTTDAQQDLINQFKAHTIRKGYLVLVKGKLVPTDGIIEAPIGRDPHNRKRMAVVSESKQARTRYHVIQYLDDYTLLEVTTETGRTHQIRVHLSAIGFPVAGDRVYGVKSVHFNRQFVHAYKLEFHLPSSGDYKEFTCELPADLERGLFSLTRR